MYLPVTHYIQDYRDSKKIMLNVEYRLMQGLSPPGGYDPLMHIQKLEIFRSAIENTAGDDLAKILWHRSETSEAWLLRRASYTRSLAVMSMVGYILGLGDRHPSNLMVLLLALPRLASFFFLLLCHALPCFSLPCIAIPY